MGSVAALFQQNGLASDIRGKRVGASRSHDFDPEQGTSTCPGAPSGTSRSRSERRLGLGVPLVFALNGVVCDVELLLQDVADPSTSWGSVPVATTT